MKKTNCWLSNFNLEYISADFAHEGNRIHKVDMVDRIITYTGKTRTFDVGKKDSYDRNNARNRDAFAIAKANFILEGEKRLKLDGYCLKTTDLDDTEDTIIAHIDNEDV